MTTITGTDLLSRDDIRDLQRKAIAIAEDQARALFAFVCDTAQGAWDNRGNCLVTTEERQDFALYLPNLTTEAHEIWLMKLLHAACTSNDAYRDWEQDMTAANRQDMTDADNELTRLCHKALALNAEAAR